MRYYIFLITILFFSISVYTEGNVSAEKLLSVLKHGTPVTQEIYKTDDNQQPSVKIYELQSDNYALFFEADMDIDCDGERDEKCNEDTDPWFYNNTSAGRGIWASVTPFYVIPVSFDCEEYGIELGSIGAVIYEDKVAYGPLLDRCGVDDVIGEASYAMAEYLGINPDPQYGGTPGPVTYIAFSGPSAQVDSDNYTNHEKAVELGSARAQELVDFFNVSINNPSWNGPTVLSHNAYRISLPDIHITGPGSHTVSVTNIKGQQVLYRSGLGKQVYSLAGISSGLYIIKVDTPQASVVERVLLY